MPRKKKKNIEIKELRVLPLYTVFVCDPQKRTMEDEYVRGCGPLCQIECLWLWKSVLSFHDLVIFSPEKPDQDFFCCSWNDSGASIESSSMQIKPRTLPCQFSRQPPLFKWSRSRLNGVDNARACLCCWRVPEKGRRKNKLLMDDRMKFFPEYKEFEFKHWGYNKNCSILSSKKSVDACAVPVWSKRSYF